MTKAGTVAESSGPRPQEGAIQGQLTQLLGRGEGDADVAPLACREGPIPDPWGDENCTSSSPCG